MSAEKTTTCSKCGKTITYTTKKPKMCKECNIEEYGDRKFYHKPKGTPQRSKGEFYLNKVLNELLPDIPYIDGGYYSFLPSPKGYPMQLDRYYPRLHLAFEFDGKQHNTDVEYFYRTEEQFQYQQQCDKLKEELCSKNKITIIRIGHNERITKDLIVDKLTDHKLIDFIKERTRVVL